MKAIASVKSAIVSAGVLTTHEAQRTSYQASEQWTSILPGIAFSAG
jgi:hypothetical protein